MIDMIFPTVQTNKTTCLFSILTDTFAVQLEPSEASERCEFESGPYLLHISIKGIALIAQREFTQHQNIERCPQKAL